jgi:hypothetical protein
MHLSDCGMGLVASANLPRYHDVEANPLALAHWLPMSTLTRFSRLLRDHNFITLHDIMEPTRVRRGASWWLASGETLWERAGSPAGERAHFKHLVTQLCKDLGDSPLNGDNELLHLRVLDALRELPRAEDARRAAVPAVPDAVTWAYSLPRDLRPVPGAAAIFLWGDGSVQDNRMGTALLQGPAPPEPDEGGHPLGARVDAIGPPRSSRISGHLASATPEAAHLLAALTSTPLDTELWLFCDNTSISLPGRDFAPERPCR